MQHTNNKVPEILRKIRRRRMVYNCIIGIIYAMTISLVVITLLWHLSIIQFETFGSLASYGLLCVTLFINILVAIKQKIG